MKKILNVFLALLEYPFYAFRNIYLWIPGHMNYRENHVAMILYFLFPVSILLKILPYTHWDAITKNRAWGIVLLVVIILMFFTFFYKNKYERVAPNYDAIKGWKKWILNLYVTILIGFSIGLWIF